MLNSSCTTEELQLRTAINHRVLQCTGSEDLRGHIATTYGVSMDSILNSLKYFYVVIGLPPDIMHDVLEGALPLELKLMLKSFIAYLTLEQLNSRIN